jgi:surfeit locus 1 family protein
MAPRMSDKLRASRPSSQYILSLRFANRRFSPTMLGSLLTTVGVALFSLLGMWQLDRAEEKRALLAQFAAGQQSTVAVTAESASSLPRYQHVQARGRYDPQHQILLDNMPSESGRAGYRVLTPLALEAGGWLLVDRGWIAPGATRDALPSVAVDAELRSIVGRLDRLPEPGMRLGEDSADPGAGWPRVLNFPQYEQLERVLQRSLARGVVLLDSAQADGYERTWRATYRVGPERHLAYAVQWFAFALVAVVIYVITALKPQAT